MPFTFSHPALVLPLCAGHKKLSGTGLVMGSMAPDFEYFFRMAKGDTYYSHTWLSLLYFNLPVALLLAFVFHGVVRNPLLANLPAALSAKFAEHRHFNWMLYCKNNMGWVVLSILLGAASHLLWDGLTHTSGDYLYYRQHQLLWFRNWQHHTIIYTLVHTTHSLVGLLVLALAIARMPVHRLPAPTARPSLYWLRICGLTLAVLLLRVLLGNSPGYGDMAVSLMAAFFLSLVLGSFWAGLADTTGSGPGK